MAVMVRMRRSRGSLSGLLPILLGAWGSLIPFAGAVLRLRLHPGLGVGLYQRAAVAGDPAGASTFAGGVLLLITGRRHTAVGGALLAVAAGAWFAVGPAVSPLWNAAAGPGTPAGTGTVTRTVEQLGFLPGWALSSSSWPRRPAGCCRCRRGWRQMPGAAGSRSRLRRARSRSQGERGEGKAVDGSATACRDRVPLRGSRTG